MFWKANAERIGQEEDLVRRFSTQADEAYRELLIHLDQPDCNLTDAAHEFQQIEQRDYFHSSLGKQVRERLLAGRVGEQ